MNRFHGGSEENRQIPARADSTFYENIYFMNGSEKKERKDFPETEIIYFGLWASDCEMRIQELKQPTSITNDFQLFTILNRLSYRYINLLMLNRSKREKNNTAE